MGHKVYKAIVTAVKSGQLKEPFTNLDFKMACPNFGKSTYYVFLKKHCVNNGSTSELFDEVSKKNFVCLRPFKYGL